MQGKLHFGEAVTQVIAVHATANQSNDRREGDLTGQTRNQIALSWPTLSYRPGMTLRTSKDSRC